MDLSWITPELITTWLVSTWAQALYVMGGSIALAILVSINFARVKANLGKRERTDFDKMVSQFLGRPVAISILLGGFWYATNILEPGEALQGFITAVIESVAVVVWSFVGIRLSLQLVEIVSQVGSGKNLVGSRILPVLDLGAKVIIVSMAAYGLLLAWGVDLTAWLASAGILGIAVGLAAQDTLGNLFAGVAVVVDAPYKLGDFIELSDGRCGRVTEIGLRSTRIVTEDLIEVIVPNSTMASTSIINWTGGPSQHMRCKTVLGVAYGSDIEVVRTILVEVAQGVEGVVTSDESRFTPQAQLRNFGDSSIDFTLLYWIDHPERRMAILDLIHSQVFHRFAAEGIEIPFPQRDLHLIQPKK